MEDRTDHVIKMVMYSPADALKYLQEDLSKPAGQRVFPDLNARAIISRAELFAQLTTDGDVCANYIKIALLVEEACDRKRLPDDLRLGAMWIMVYYIRRFPETECARAFIDDVNEYIDCHLIDCKMLLIGLDADSKRKMIEAGDRDSLGLLGGLKSRLWFASYLFGFGVLKNEAFLKSLWLDKDWF